MGKIDIVFHKGEFCDQKPHGFDWKGCKTNPDFEIITQDIPDDLQHDSEVKVKLADGTEHIIYGIALGAEPEPVVLPPIVFSKRVITLPKV